MHIFTDADNTLWDTNYVYAQAQLWMLREVEARVGVSVPAADDNGLAFLRAVDQRIAKIHLRGLRYPPALLASGLALALQGKPPEEAAALSIAASNRGDGAAKFHDCADGFLVRLRNLPQLRPGVAEGLPALVSLQGFPVTIVTEESRERCEARLAAHGLNGLVDEIVSANKNRNLYRHLRQRWPAAADQAVMIGDQFDRDVEPARQEGYRAFHFPGGFNPFWTALTADGRTDVDTVMDFREIATKLADPIEVRSRPVAKHSVGSRPAQRS